MTILRKSIVTSVIPGNPEIPEVVGNPYIPAHTSVKTIYEMMWVDAPGITWEKVPYSTAQTLGSYWVWENGRRVLKYISSPGQDSVIAGVMYYWRPLYYGGPVPEGKLIMEHKLVTVKYTVYYPATPAAPSTEGVPARDNQISHSLNKGWNSYARSINKLNKGDFYIFTAEQGITGAFIGVGHPGMLGKTISSFRNGVLVDLSGVKAYDNGAVIGTLKNSHDAASKIRIHRQIDNSIVYVITTGTETKVIESATTPATGELYLYAYLYSGGDKILTSELKTGRVVFGEVK